MKPAGVGALDPPGIANEMLEEGLFPLPAREKTSQVAFYFWQINQQARAVLWNQIGTSKIGGFF
ncbi:hypothetical protein [Hydrogenophaga laconesensis]|uniref:hypothetical protein n=1 Tax=Hydrogenophaga laconesensis TaxID=1805971 RepID=UPI004042E580